MWDKYNFEYFFFLYRELEELRSHLDIIKQSHFSAGQAEIEAERMAYETSISQLKGRVNDLESALSSTTFDLEEVRKIYNYQMKELECILPYFF